MVHLGSSGDWRLRGEGNANAVYCYTGSRGDLIGKVLRARKKSTEEVKRLDGLEQEIWETLHGLLDRERESLDVAYVDQVMRPSLGCHLVGDQIPVKLQPEFATALLQLLQEGGRQPAPAALHTKAVLIPDFTFLPAVCTEQLVPGPPQTSSGTPSKTANCKPAALCAVMKPEAAIVCVEIKPKCGFLPNAATIHPSNQIKKRVSRFQLQQRLKLAEGNISTISKYNPLDLFSGDPQRCRHAIHCLLECPQNNFKIFLDGQPLQPSLYGYGLGPVFGVQAEQPLTLLVQLVSLILEKTGVLSGILEVQQLDRHDIEAVHAMYTSLAPRDALPGLPADSLAAEHRNQVEDSEEGISPACGELQQYNQALDALLSLPRETALAVLRDYLIATTAKDCSVMLAFRKLDDGDSDSTCPDRVVLDNQTWQYRIGIVDLDMKSVQKIQSHFELDCRILQQAGNAEGDSLCLVDNDASSSSA